MKRFELLALFVLLLANCSGKSDVTLYHEGTIAEETGNFQLAVDRYEEIVNRFQKSAYAESALYRAGLVYNNDLHDLQRAVGAYRRYYAFFPESKQAPTALFLSGFLLNNELHQTDSARVMYQTFLEKYPTHELAASAKFELETLGKDPGPLLKLDTAVDRRARAAPQATQ
jgi:TolA-binding protein